MAEIKSVLLIDNSDIDNFINYEILVSHGVTNVTVLKNAVAALPFLAGTTIYYQYILVDIHLPMINGFQFIDKFNELGLNKFHGQICLLSATINPLDEKLASERNVRFIEKPLTIEKLLI